MTSAKGSKGIKRKRFEVDLLFLDGDGDYGALTLEQAYSHNILRQKCKENGGEFTPPSPKRKEKKQRSTDNVASSDQEEEDDDADDGDLSSCSASIETYTFSSKADQKTAIKMVESILNSDVIDEDHAKKFQRDCLARTRLG